LVITDDVSVEIMHSSTDFYSINWT
jgi:hypothetical protein